MGHSLVQIMKIFHKKIGDSQSWSGHHDLRTRIFDSSHSWSKRLSGSINWKSWTFISYWKTEISPCSFASERPKSLVFFRHYSWNLSKEDTERPNGTGALPLNRSTQLGGMTLPWVFLIITIHGHNFVRTVLVGTANFTPLGLGVITTVIQGYFNWCFMKIIRPRLGESCWISWADLDLFRGPPKNICWSGKSERHTSCFSLRYDYRAFFSTKMVSNTISPNTIMKTIQIKWK